MSIRKLETCVLDCDGCDAVFGDLVPMALKTVEALATEAGWEVRPERDFCPACVNKRSEPQEPKFQ